MGKGRTALPGTYEARDFIVEEEEYTKWLESCPVSEEAKARIDKAIHFGVGIKDAETYKAEKKARINKLKAELGELEG